MIDTQQLLALLGSIFSNNSQPQPQQVEKPESGFGERLKIIRPYTRDIDPNAEFGSFFDTEDYMPGSDKRGLPTQQGPRVLREAQLMQKFAQGSLGSRVPPDSLFDSPQYLVDPQPSSVPMSNITPEDLRIPITNTLLDAIFPYRSFS